MSTDLPTEPDRVSSGVPGLDEILIGGLPRDRITLVEGVPGTGKTTLALQFLLDGVRRGETGLFVTLSETEDELRAMAASHGWSLDALTIHELKSAELDLPASATTLFHPSELELGDTMRSIFEQIERIEPRRAVFDSLAILRLMARDPILYRRHVLGVKQYFAERHGTILLLDDRVTEPGDLDLRGLAHGVIRLERDSRTYGPERRRLIVTKLRGAAFRSGFHDFTIVRGGLVVFPRLCAPEEAVADIQPLVSSGLAELDALLGGGLHPGTATLILGPSGTGKSSLAAQYARAAAGRGEAAVIFTIDENIGTIFARLNGLGLTIQEQVGAGRIFLEQVDPTVISPGELMTRIRHCVEERSARVLVLDSLTGLLNAMPEESLLLVQFHELLTYLDRHGVVSLIVVAQHGLMGPALKAHVDLSYLADAVILLRCYEAGGEVRHAISVFKKRTGPHDRAIRTFQLGPQGLHVGPPIRETLGTVPGELLGLGGGGDDPNGT